MKVARKTLKPGTSWNPLHILILLTWSKFSKLFVAYEQWVQNLDLQWIITELDRELWDVI